MEPIRESQMRDDESYTALDREFFEKNPGVNVYKRFNTSDEPLPVETAGLPCVCCHAGEFEVEVKQLAPGVRMRTIKTPGYLVFDSIQVDVEQTDKHYLDHFDEYDADAHAMWAIVRSQILGTRR